METATTIYMIETKPANEINTPEVQAKKLAAEKYCQHASDYTAKHNGKTWKYLILPHTDVSRTSSFEYLISIS